LSHADADALAREFQLQLRDFRTSMQYFEEVFQSCENLPVIGAQAIHGLLDLGRDLLIMCTECALKLDSPWLQSKLPEPMSREQLQAAVVPYPANTILSLTTIWTTHQIERLSKDVRVWHFQVDSLDKLFFLGMYAEQNFDVAVVVDFNKNYLTEENFGPIRCHYGFPSHKGERYRMSCLVYIGDNYIPISTNHKDLRFQSRKNLETFLLSSSGGLECLVCFQGELSMEGKKPGDSSAICPKCGAIHCCECHELLRGECAQCRRTFRVHRSADGVIHTKLAPGSQ